jgi:hypothetical protein
MELITALLVLTAPLYALAAADTPTSRPETREDAGLSFNPHHIVTSPLAYQSTAPEPANEPATNAERLRRGLPLKAPRRSRTSAAKRAVPSPVTTYGVLQVRGASGNMVGYVGAIRNSYGQYGFTTNPALRLLVSFTYTPNDNNVNIAISDPSYSILAATVRPPSTNNDLGPGSYNYAYLTGARSAVPAGSPAQDAPNTYTDSTGVPADSETSIWAYDSSTGVVSARWINGDGSVASTQIAYNPRDNLLVLVGDLTSFNNYFHALYPPATVVLVPA